MITVAKCSRSWQFMKKDHLIDIVRSDLSIRSGFWMTHPTELIYFGNPNIKVAQLTRVCIWVRTRLLKTVKLGFIRACLLATNQKRFEVMRWYGGGVRLLKVKARHIATSQSHLCWSKSDNNRSVFRAWQTWQFQGCETGPSANKQRFGVMRWCGGGGMVVASNYYIMIVMQEWQCFLGFP